MPEFKVNPTVYFEMKYAWLQEKKHTCRFGQAFLNKFCPPNVAYPYLYYLNDNRFAMEYIEEYHVNWE